MFIYRYNINRFLQYPRKRIDKMAKSSPKGQGRSLLDRVPYGTLCDEDDYGLDSNLIDPKKTPKTNLDRLVKRFLCARMPDPDHDALNQDILGEVPKPLEKVFQNTFTPGCEADAGIIKGMVQNLVDSLNEALVKTTERRATLKRLLDQTLEDYLQAERKDRMLRAYISSFKEDIKVLATTKQKYKKSQYVQECRRYLAGIGMEGTDGLLSGVVISLAHYNKFAQLFNIPVADIEHPTESIMSVMGRDQHVGNLYFNSHPDFPTELADYDDEDYDDYVWAYTVPFTLKEMGMYPEDVENRKYRFSLYTSKDDVISDKRQVSERYADTYYTPRD